MHWMVQSQFLPGWVISTRLPGILLDLEDSTHWWCLWWALRWRCGWPASSSPPACEAAGTQTAWSLQQSWRGAFPEEIHHLGQALFVLVTPNRSFYHKELLLHSLQGVKATNTISLPGQTPLFTQRGIPLLADRELQANAVRAGERLPLEQEWKVQRNWPGRVCQSLCLVAATCQVLGQDVLRHHAEFSSRGLHCIWATASCCNLE